MTTYQAGDRVAYARFGSSYPSPKFSTVSKVLSTVIVLENGRRFNHQGRELKSTANPYPSDSLWSAEKAEELLARREEEHAKARTVRELEQAIAGKRTGAGNCHLSERAIELMQELTIELARVS